VAGSVAERLDTECRYHDNGFEIVQIDKDFAFNYRMLHPATLASLGKFLPQDPQTGKPRFPVPESTLLSVFSSLPFCLETILAKLKGLLDKMSEPTEPAAREAERTAFKDFALELIDVFSALVPAGPPRAFLVHVKEFLAHREGKAALDRALEDKRLLKRELANLVLSLVLTGTGTGSGSDCLGASGLIRFVNLDRFIPPAGVAPESSLARSASGLSANSDSLRSSQSGSTAQVLRGRQATVPAHLRGRVSGPPAPTAAEQSAPAAAQPRKAPKGRTA
jgi:hypothetical protein